MKFAEKCMKLGNTEVTKKDKYHVFFFVYES